MSIFEYDEAKELGRIKQAIWNDARSEGLKHGLEQGRSEGLEQGRNEGLINAILMCKDLNISKDETVAKVAERFDVDLSKARGLVEEYWD